MNHFPPNKWSSLFQGLAFLSSSCLPILSARWSVSCACSRGTASPSSCSSSTWRKAAQFPPRCITLQSPEEDALEVGVWGWPWRRFRSILVSPTDWLLSSSWVTLTSKSVIKTEIMIPVFCALYELHEDVIHISEIHVRISQTWILGKVQCNCSQATRRRLFSFRLWEFCAKKWSS